MFDISRSALYITTFSYYYLSFYCNFLILVVTNMQTVLVCFSVIKQYNLALYWQINSDAVAGNVTVHLKENSGSLQSGCDYVFTSAVA